MDAEPTDEQLTFFGTAERVAPQQEHPPEIMDALRVVSGTAIPGENGGLEGLTGAGANDLVEQAGGTAQERFFQKLRKKGDRDNSYQVLSEPKVEVFDIATPEGREGIEKVYAILGDPQNGFVGHESAPQHHLDCNSSVGYRVIVVIKYWKPVTKIKEHSTANYTQVQAPPTLPPATKD